MHIFLLQEFKILKDTVVHLSLLSQKPIISIMRIHIKIRLFIIYILLEISLLVSTLKQKEKKKCKYTFIIFKNHNHFNKIQTLININYHVKQFVQSLVQFTNLFLCS